MSISKKDSLPQSSGKYEELTVEKLGKFLKELTLTNPVGEYVVLSYCRGRGKTVTFTATSPLCTDPECGWCAPVREQLKSYGIHDISDTKSKDKE